MEAGASDDVGGAAGNSLALLGLPSVAQLKINESNSACLLEYEENVTRPCGLKDGRRVATSSRVGLHSSDRAAEFPPSLEQGRFIPL